MRGCRKIAQRFPRKVALRGCPERLPGGCPEYGSVLIIHPYTNNLLNIEIINNKARHNLMDAKCRWRSDWLDGGMSLRSNKSDANPPGGDTKPPGGDNP